MACYNNRQTKLYDLNVKKGVCFWPSKACLLIGRVHCFSMQVVINKCFLLNSEKKFGTDSSCRLRKTVNRLQVSLQLPETMVSRSL